MGASDLPWYLALGLYKYTNPRELMSNFYGEFF